ncbi:MAG: chemotaxis protein CheW [Brachymonas sp.]|nr:chemotaxis protein CheW [Brachymonas sp.]
MANKQALRELQQRIASLLQEAQSEPGLTASWLGVRLGGHRLLLPLQQSGEIYAMTPIQPLPYTKPWFLGVAPLRSQVYGVVELGAFLPAEPAADQAAAFSSAAHPAKRAKPCLLALNEALGMNVVFRVDGLEGLRSREAFVRSEAPAEGAPAHLGSTFIDGDGIHWQEINLQALAQDPQFLDIAAAPTLAAHALSH